jgi:hypothetical protein
LQTLVANGQWIDPLRKPGECLSPLPSKQVFRTIRR